MTEPLVLLHGASMSARAWEPVRAALEAHHEVLVPTMAGHRGGAAWPDGTPVGVAGIVDDVETLMDAAGMPTAHLVGNSLGGWVALELARRGRARSVVALSPAGGWGNGWDLRRLVWSFRLGSALAGSTTLRTAARRPWMRRLLLARVLERGDRVPTEDVGELFDDLAGCVILRELLDGAAEHGGVAPFDDLPCPVRVAWSGRDRLIPWRRHGVALRERLPGAEFVRLPRVGHVPMWDDPDLVVDAVLGVTTAHRTLETPA
ncbi:pimeloyl-ACP methyl ester carboxylesterase [Actinomycetospora succinea]|uniref:Pimeloyl-ACP methyl ester carboxylesterase n=1 Tax=Actinomycetospora succinea TaxID=663603 RepID=A0A4V3D7H5_9PSEU|nr:alpha/beta fold hydrolase [Actinomycetospora succinea]TDQ47907.1 pimeloyl-ACP methyl ester carboxylesterase [Actinomycetospora succinea]